MTQATVDENLAAARAAIETMLYSWEDTITPIVERIQDAAHENLEPIVTAIQGPLARLLTEIDVILPGEAEAHPDWEGLDRLVSQIDANLAASELVVGNATERVLDQVNTGVSDLAANPLDLVSSLIKLLGDLASGIVGNTIEAPELWQDLYTVLKAAFSADSGPISNWVAETGDAIAHSAGSLLEQTKSGTEIIESNLITGNNTTPLNPNELAARMDAWPPWVKSIVSIALHFQSAWSVLSALSSPIVAEAAQGALKQNPISPLSAAQLAGALRRQYVGEGFARDEAKRTGVSPELFDIIYKLTQGYLTADNYVEMWRRTGNDSELDNLHILGLSDDDISRLRTLALAVPTPSDLVRFMVRDVFDPSAITTGQLDDEFDQKVNQDWNRRVGIDNESLKLYWMAHWSLPSPTMFYEMFHRGFIDQAKLVEGLKLADYAPGWIDNLVNINYNVPGRIDVRRMWESGVITTREELVKRHKDMGYSPEDADTLATFVERIAEKSRAAETERLHAPIAAEIIRSYGAGGLDYDTALNDLIGLGYSPELATFRLQLGIFERERDRASRIKSAIAREYIHGFMSEDAVREYLSEHGFEANEQDSLLQTWQLDKELRDLTEEKRHERDLSKSEIVSAYADRILTRDDAASALVALGYDNSEADTILQLEDARQQKADNKAAEQAIQREYITRRIEAQKAESDLAGFGYTPQRIAALMTRWTVERDERRPDLSAAQVERMLTQGVIPKDRAEELLRQRGYSDEHVAFLMTLYGADMADAQATIDERRREFDIREQRLREQGGRRLDLTQRGQDLTQQRFGVQQTGIEQRFTATQTQQRALQSQRLDAAQLLQNQRIAASTQRDAIAFAERRSQQEKQIAAVNERTQKQIDAANARADAQRSLSRDLAQQRADLQARASAAQDARQRASLEAQASRVTQQIEAADARAQQAINARADLQQQRAESAAALAEIRAHIQEARDIANNARRIADEARQEQVRIRQETRAASRKAIDAGTSAANASALQSLQFQQTAAVAEVTSRFATLTAQLAQQRQQDALAARQAAEQALAAATPAASMLDTNV